MFGWKSPTPDSAEQRPQSAATTAYFSPPGTPATAPVEIPVTQANLSPPDVDEHSSAVETSIPPAQVLVTVVPLAVPLAQVEEHPETESEESHATLVGVDTPDHRGATNTVVAEPNIDSPQYDSLGHGNNLNSTIPTSNTVSSVVPTVPDQNATLRIRATMVETGLTPKTKERLAKVEVKDAKRLSKILKNEGKAEEKLLKNTMKDLDSIQKAQKRAVQDETSAITAHAKAVKQEQKLSKVFLEAKAKYDQAVVDLRAKTEQLDSIRTRALEKTALLQGKSKEVDQIRLQKASDDRERQAKLATLGNAP